MGYKMDSAYAGMLSEDHSAPANLPQEVVHKYYPKCKYMDRYELDDTMNGLDDTRNYDIKKIQSEEPDSKW